MSINFNNASWSGLVTGLRAFLGLANALLAVRLVGVEAYGHLITVLSVFVIYVSLNTNLYTIVVVKLTSYAGLEQQSERSEILMAVTFLTGSSLLVLGITTALIYWQSPDFLRFGGSTKDGLLLLMAAVCGLQILTALQGALVEASGRLDLTMKAQLTGPAALLAILTAMVLLNRPLTGKAYLEILCVSAVLDLGVIWLIRRLKAGPIRWQKIGPKTIKQLSALVGAGSPLQATALMNLFLDPLNRILLGYFNEAASVTIYDLAMKIIWGIQSLFTSAMRVFLHFNNLSDSRINQAYIHVITLIVVPTLIVHTAGAAFLYCVANWWVTIDLQSLLLFYSLATLSNLGMIFITPLYIRLINRQDLGFIVKSQTILAFTNTAISIVTIPLFGLFGAALGLLIATLYNVPAIYRRYQRQVAPLDGLTKLLAPTLILRAGLALGLFAATIYASMSGRVSLLLAVALGASLFLMIITEPLTRRIVTSFYINAMGKRTDM